MNKIMGIQRGVVPLLCKESDSWIRSLGPERHAESGQEEREAG